MTRSKGSKDSKTRQKRVMSEKEKQKRSEDYQKRRRQRSQPAQPPQQQLTPKGGLAFDEHGMALLDCNRGTDDVENSHKQIVSTFGGWHASISFSDDLHDERRHRLNHGISERKRPGFPVV